MAVQVYACCYVDVAVRMWLYGCACVCVGPSQETTIAELEAARKEIIALTTELEAKKTELVAKSNLLDQESVSRRAYERAVDELTAWKKNREDADAAKKQEEEEAIKRKEDEERVKAEEEAKAKLAWEYTHDGDFVSDGAGGCLWSRFV